MKTLKCKCGGRIVENDSHYICERYLEDIKRGVREQQDIINEFNENVI